MMREMWGIEGICVIIGFGLCYFQCACLSFRLGVWVRVCEELDGSSTYFKLR